MSDMDDDRASPGEHEEHDEDMPDASSAAGEEDAEYEGGSSAGEEDPENLFDATTVGTRLKLAASSTNNAVHTRSTRSHASPPTSGLAQKPAASDQTCEACGRGRKGGKGGGRRGPNNEPWCDACGMAYNRECKKAESEGRPVGDAWKGRVTRRGRLGPDEKEAKDEEKRRKKEAKDETGRKKKEAEDERKRKIQREKDATLWKQRRRYDHTCKDCHTHNSSDWTDDLCDFCRQRHQAYASVGELPPAFPSNLHIAKLPSQSFAGLQQLAVSSFRQQRPDYHVNEDDTQPGYTPNDYWFLSVRALLVEIMSRGISTSAFKKDETQAQDATRLVNILQMEDARHGLLPRPRPSGASRYHLMANMHLIQLAVDRGYKRADGQDSARVIAYLLANEPPAAAYDTEVDAASMQLAAGMLVTDLAESLGLSSAAPNVRPRTTHNHGIVGNVEALDSLSDTLMHNWFPARTSAAGLLCGPNATEISLEARREAWRRNHPGVPPSGPRIRADDMMELLFQEYVAGEFVPPGTLGTPTPDYEAYIEHTIGHLREVEYRAYVDNYNAFLAMNDLNLQQIEAILELLWQQGMIEEHYGLGVVTGARTATTDDGREVELPTNARIAREGEDGAPVLWLYNNAAFGAGRYRHWEGMDGTGRLERALEWGMRVGDAGLLERTKKPQHNSEVETKAQRLSREATNARILYLKHCRAFRKMCLPCRRKDVATSSCDGRPGIPCSTCEPGECEWPAHEIPFPTIHIGTGNLTSEDIIDWDTNISQEEREKFLHMTLTHQLDPETKSDHFLCIFTARMSSHQGQNAFQQILNDLVTTQNTYDNLLNGPLFNNVPEGQRPGGPNTPMRAYRQVIARHGTRKVPIRLGNLQDPFLITMVNLIHHVMRANNPNLPIEIQFVNMGLAGFSVDITGWGDRNHGFFRYILDQDLAHGTNVARRIYIVAIVEPHVVDGVATHSLDYPNPSPYYQGHQNKYLIKLRLMDLIDRWAYCQPIWVANYRNARWNVANPHLPPRATPPPVVWANSNRLDPFLEAFFWEMAWRSGWTDGNTRPTAAQVAARQNDRNRGHQ